MVIERIYEAWLKAPDLRLGQFLLNADYYRDFGPNLQEAEDFDLAIAAEMFVCGK